MQIWIHDKNMRKVCALNNNVPGMLPYSNSQWHPYLEYSTSTFDFTIPKIVNGKLHEDVKYINDDMFVSFYYDNSYQVFYVSQLVENDTTFQVTCNNTNLELAQEQSVALKANGAQNIAWYLEHLEILGFTNLEIGVNEVSDKTRTLEFEPQDTKLAQLHSLMSKFDAEFAFRTELNRDGTIKRFTIDIYQIPDENHHGIGKARGDVVLHYQNELKGVQVTSDKTQLFNAGVFTGADGVNLESVEFEEKNELGQVEFYSRKGSSYVFAPLSRERYPSTMNPNNADNWTRKDFQTEYKDVNSLKGYALRTIKQYAYPLLTYTVDVHSSFMENYRDVNLGDTVKIINNNFRGGLALEARVTEMVVSFDMPLNNSVVFSNYRKIVNKPSSDLQQRIDEIAARALPYRVEITTTNGTAFKNGVGRSTVRPVLKQGDKTVNATWRFVIDGAIKYVGMTYDMVASQITQPTALTVSAWVDNKEVASEEVTFLNVSDGRNGAKGDPGPKGDKGEQGPKGDRGNDGLPGKNGVGLKTTTITYGMSDSDTVMPTSWTSNPPILVKGKYLWTKTQWMYTDLSSETGYQKTYIPQNGSKGDDGLPGKDGVGLVNTTLRYAKSMDGVNKPSGVVVANFPNEIKPNRSTVDNNVTTDFKVRLEQGKTYILSAETNGTFTNQHNTNQQSDNATIWLVNPSFSTWVVISDTNTADGTRYTHNRPTGEYNIRVNSYKTDNSTWVKNIVFEDGTWSPDIPTVNPGEYLWTRTTWFYSDGTNEQGFSVAKMGEQGPKGDRGNDGIPGKNGIGIRNTSVLYGLSASETVPPTAWYQNPPALVKGQWFWTKTVWTYTDNTTETGYQKTYVARDGNDGNNGIAGKDGVGIRSTTITYAQGTSGTVAPTTGWTSQVPNVPAGQFLWTKTVWSYTDNTNETGYSVSKIGEQGPQGVKGDTGAKGDRGEKGLQGERGLTGPAGPQGLQGPKGDQGIPGVKGADGKTQYTHIAYADTVSGGGFSQADTNKAFIGMYQDFNATDSRNPQDYRWSKWKGSDGRDGIPGKAGADGRTPYVHFAYADSADGRTGFSLTQDGNKRYLGVCTNFDRTDSTNPADYSWNDMTGSVSVGGENLIRNSAFPDNLDGWGYWLATQPNSNLSVSSHSFYYNGSKPMFLLSTTTTTTTPSATLRFPVKRNTNYSLNVSVLAGGNLKGMDIYFLGRKSNETKDFSKVVNIKHFDGSPSTSGVKKFHFTFNTGECDEGFIRIDNTGTTNGSQSLLFFTELDCYEGTTDRAWQASPKDLKSQLDGKADSALTQDQINKLNELNSIVQAELKAKASLSVVNQWVKAYQDFLSTNQENKNKTEKALVEASQRIVKLQNDLGETSQRWNFLDNYMRASNEGLTIGKNDGSNSVLVSDKRISMFSAGTEVMYIDKGVIHIENGIFSKSIQIGYYREEQDLIDPNRNVIKWVGGNY
nr:MAG TPA: tail protein [Caudoviricetes sp.]